MIEQGMSLFKEPVKTIMELVEARYKPARELNGKIDVWKKLGFNEQDSKSIVTIQESGRYVGLDFLVESAKKHLKNSGYVLDEKGLSKVKQIIDTSEFITDEDILDLLGRTLAGEFDKTSNVSPRTLNTIKLLTSKELSILLELRPFLWKISDMPFQYLITSSNKEINNYIGLRKYINFEKLDILEQANLITPNGYSLNSRDNVKQVIESGITISVTDRNNKPQEIVGRFENIKYKEKTFQIGVTENNNKLPLGDSELTYVGKEILELYKNEPCDDIESYLDNILTYWENSGLVIIENWPSSEEITKQILDKHTETILISPNTYLTKLKSETIS